MKKMTVRELIQKLLEYNLDAIVNCIVNKKYKDFTIDSSSNLEVEEYNKLDYPKRKATEVHFNPDGISHIERELLDALENKDKLLTNENPNLPIS